MPLSFLSLYLYANTIHVGFVTYIFQKVTMPVYSDLASVFSVQFRTNASRSGILISGFKDGQFLAPSSDNTFHEQLA